MGIGKRIKERRTELGLTQEKLGEMVGLQKSAIAKYENGRVENIKQATFDKMAKALKCSPSYLLGQSEVNEEQDAQKALLYDIISYLEYFKELNNEGRSKLLAYASDLVKDEKYTTKLP